MGSGIWKNNPVLVQMIGLCPVLYLTAQAWTAIEIGLCTLAVLLGATIAVLIVRRAIPPKARVFAGLLITAGMVSLLDYSLQIYFPAVRDSLSFFVPLVTVNCLIIGRLTVVGFRGPPGRALVDALGMGTGFTLIAGIVGGIREILGEGTVFGASLARFGVGGGILPLLRFPAGGFLVLGLLATLATRGSSWDQRKGEEQ